MRNACLTFVCKDADLRVENNRTLFTSAYRAGEEIRIPVAHHDGNYQADAETLARLEGEGEVALRYACTVNGSANDIAGIVNARGNVLGLMPHPERAAEPAHGNEDGRRLFESLIGALSPA
jgi:phosphoribosylformylglycinamidine synthase